jgi:hypothetical protein
VDCRIRSNWLFRCAAAVAIVLAVAVYCVALAAAIGRSSLFYLGATGLLIPPIAYWGHLRFRRVCLVFAAAAFALSVSPVDYKIQATGRPRISLVRATFLGSRPHDGGSTPEDVARYGCVVPLNAPRHVVLIQY